MQFFPDWAPNWHPLIIHFPIVLIIFAFLADMGKAIFKKAEWLSGTSLFLYISGTLFAIIAYFTGKQAADSVNFPPDAYSVVSTHADYALYTIIFLGIYTVIRIIGALKKWDSRKSILGILVFLGFVGVLLIQQTAELGGMLVYKYGVGTEKVKIQSESEEIAPTSSTLKPIRIKENGSWYWEAGRNSLDSFQWIKTPTPVSLLSDDSLYVSFHLEKPQFNLAVFGTDLERVQIKAEVNLQKFDGIFYLIHHFNDSANYDFLAIENGLAKLGRIENGKMKIFHSKNFVAEGKIELKVVGTNGHFRGYANNDLIVHGHAVDLPAGKAGFGFSGKGTIKLFSIRVLSLNSPGQNQHSH
jgi:uncharacterized membrane protein